MINIPDYKDKFRKLTNNYFGTSLSTKACYTTEAKKHARFIPNLAGSSELS